MAAYTVVVIYQAGRLTDLVERTSETQKQSISAISQQTMDAVLEKSQTQNTGMLAYTIGDYFGDAANTVNMLGDYAAHLFAEPDA